MRSTGIQLRIGDLLYALLKRWKLIVSLTFMGMVFGLLLTGMTHIQSSLQSYDIRGSFAISTYANGTFLGGNTRPTNQDFTTAENMVDSVSYLLRSVRVLEEVINDQAILGTSASDLRSRLAVSRHNATQILELRLSWLNPEEGIAIWQSVIEQTNLILPAVLKMGSLIIINEPVASVTIVGSSGNTLALLLTALGFAAGAGFAVLELLVHPTLTNVKDIETMFGLETIGIIPRDNIYFRQKKTSLLVQEDTGSSDIIQNFASAAYILRNRLGNKEQHHCFYVTSAIAQEGKTTVAANLAIQLSDMERRTLLIDFDMRNPSLGSLFLGNVDYNRSLNSVYRGEATAKDAITTLTGYLDLLPMVLEHNGIMLDSAIVDLITQLKEEYEYVIIDASPVGIASETLSLNQVAATVLFVIGYDMASIPEIQNSLEKLEKAGTRILGCIANVVQNSRSKGFGKDEERRKPARPKKTKKEKDFTAKEEEQENEIKALLRNGKKKEKQEVPEQEKKSGLFRRKKNAKAEPETASETENKEKAESGQKSPDRKEETHSADKKNKAEVRPANEKNKAEAHPADEKKKASPSTGGFMTRSSKPRNLMDDIFAEAESRHEVSDQGVLEELLKIGIDSDKDD